MRKILTLFCTALFCMCMYASPKVDDIAVRLTDYPVAQTPYDTAYTVLDNTIHMYIYKDPAFALPNEPIHFICRVRINKQWYRVPYKDFSRLYFGRKLSKKELTYIKQLNNE